LISWGEEKNFPGLFEEIKRKIVRSSFFTNALQGREKRKPILFNSSKKGKKNKEREERAVPFTLFPNFERKKEDADDRAA